MRSDIIHVTNTGEGTAEALLQAERVAAFRDLPKKEAIHLRLLTEEMMGMMQALTGEKEADFWIEDNQDAFRLHLKVEAIMNSEMRKKLLAVSTKGTNAAVKGIMGKIKDLFDRILEPMDAETPGARDVAYIGTGEEYGHSSVPMESVWTLSQYRADLQKEHAPKEDWDELEKSVVARLADDVQIGIAENEVEMVIFRKK